MRLPSGQSWTVSELNTAIFLDRDGTLIRDVPNRRELVDPEDFYPGVLPTLQQFAQAGFLLFMVTNQGAVARKTITMEDVKRVNQSLTACVSLFGAAISDIAVCPHHPSIAGPCDCRKPSPHMLITLAKRHAIDLNNSWMVGDNISDVESGISAGCRAALVLTGQGCAHVGTVHSKYEEDVVIVNSLQSLVPLIKRQL